MLFMILAVFILFQQPFFLCDEFDGNLVDIREWWTLADNYEAATTGMMATFISLHLAAIFNVGSTYRAGFFRNWPFLAFYSVFFGILSYVLLADPNFLGCALRINCGTPEALERLGYSVPTLYVPGEYVNGPGHNVFPMYFRLTLYVLTIVNLIAGLLFENFVILGLVRRALKRWRPLKRTNLKN